MKTPFIYNNYSSENMIFDGQTGFQPSAKFCLKYENWYKKNHLYASYT